MAQCPASKTPRNNKLVRRNTTEILQTTSPVDNPLINPIPAPLAIPPINAPRAHGMSVICLTLFGVLCLNLVVVFEWKVSPPIRHALGFLSAVGRVRVGLLLHWIRCSWPFIPVAVTVTSRKDATAKMEALQSRIESFNKSKRLKSSKSSKKSSKWPHPQIFQANPEALAEAGFYFNPSPEDKDNVTCFECGKQLSEWEEDDDPFDLHWKKCGDKCSWAAVRCGLREDMDRRGRYGQELSS